MKLILHTLIVCGIAMPLLGQEVNPPVTWTGACWGYSQHDITGLNHPEIHNQVIEWIYPHFVGNEEIKLYQSTAGFNELQLKWFHDPFLFKQSFLKIGISYQTVDKQNIHPYYSHLFLNDPGTPTLDVHANGLAIDVAGLRKSLISEKLFISYGVGVNIGYLFNRNIIYQRQKHEILVASDLPVSNTGVINIRNAIQHKYFVEVGVIFEIAPEVHMDVHGRFGSAYEEIFQFKSSVFEELRGLNVAIWYNLTER